MTTKTENHPLNTQLTLHDDTETPLTISVVNLTLTKQNNQIIECRITFKINPKIYQQIDKKALFNLKPEIRTPLSNGSFQPSPDIEIEASLDPALLPQLTENTTTIHQVADYLQKINQQQPQNPLLSTYSWYGLQVKQQLETGETGYRTLWRYLQPSAITSDSISSELISEAMANFAQNWTDTNTSVISQDVMAEALEEMTRAIEELTDSFSEITEKLVEETVDEITNAFTELTESISDIPSKVTEEANIFTATINFFQAQNWQFQQIPGESTLQLAFAGENGTWDCYAKAREKQQQFIFYSICPINVPKPKRRILGEFIARANYGTIIGNFELNFDTGEIRYKTSMSVKENRLTSETFKQLVYPNVLTMDRYLPGIISVISGEMSSAKAIRQIEEIDLSPQPSNSSPGEDLIDNQPLGIPDETKESAPTSSQPPAPKLLTESDIFCRLTKEEISKFEEVMELQHSLRKQMAQSKREQLKTGLKTRLGEDGETIFEQAYKIFETSQFDAKQIRFIWRYSELYNLIQLQIEQLLIQTSGEENFGKTIQEWKKMRDDTKQRVQQIAQNYIDVQEEIEMLMEIREIREYLAVTKNK